MLTGAKTVAPVVAGGVAVLPGGYIAALWTLVILRTAGMVALLHLAPAAA